MALTLVVDASIGLKWVLDEADSHLAQALAAVEEELLLPDFWLNEACNVCWLQVRKGVWTPAEAQEAFALLRDLIPSTSTSGLDLHGVALEIGLAANHSTYDTLYLSFAIAMGARGVVVADGAFVRSMRRHPEPEVAAMLIPLSDWARGQGLA